MVNLCFSLLLYFVSYVVSNPSRHMLVTTELTLDGADEKSSRDEGVGKLCVFGRFELCLYFKEIYIKKT